MCTNAVSRHKNPLAGAGDSPSAGGLFVGDNFTAAGEQPQQLSLRPMSNRSVDGGSRGGGLRVMNSIK